MTPPNVNITPGLGDCLYKKQPIKESRSSSNRCLFSSMQTLNLISSNFREDPPEDMSQEVATAPMIDITL